MKHILLIEDELSLQQTLSEYLLKEGYSVTSCSDLRSCDSQQINKFDLILLDWMLPDGAGIDFLQELRKKGYRIPIIFLTARNDLVDKVLALESGANDYLTKPFEPRELLARIRVQLKTKQLEILESNGIKVDLQQRKVFSKGLEVSLTKTEFDLLNFLMQAAEKVFTREELLNAVWGYEKYPTTRTVDMHIMQLRNRFGVELFETIHGVGYRYRVAK